MNCLICGNSCDPTDSQTAEFIVNPAENKEPKVTYKQIIGEIFENHLLKLPITRRTDICCTCSVLLQELWRYRCEITLIEQILVRQVVGSVPSVQKCAQIIDFDAKALKTFSCDRFQSFSCKICRKFTTNRKNRIAPHYKHHEIQKDPVEEDAEYLDFNKLEVSENDTSTDVDSSNLDEVINCHIPIDVNRLTKEPYGLHQQKCTICSQICNSNRQLNRHIADNHPNYIFKCSLCNYSVRGYEGIRSHMLYIHPDTPDIQYRVKQTFVTRTVDFDIRCYQCDEILANSNVICQHTNVTEAERANVQTCNACEIPFFKPKLYLDHVVKKHTNCVICGIKCLNMRAHYQNIHRKEKLKCPDCPKQFKSKTGLDIHRAVHTGRYTHHCEHCNQGFMLRVALSEHIARVHTKTHSFTCELCGQSYVTAGELAYHRKLHSDPKPFKCQQCPSQFTSSTMLAIHRRSVHLKRFDFPCTYCDKKFASRTYLVQHLPRHTGIYLLNCAHCGQGFLKKITLQNHLAKVHNDHTMKKKVCAYRYAIRPDKEDE